MSNYTDPNKFNCRLCHTYTFEDQFYDHIMTICKDKGLKPLVSSLGLKYTDRRRIASPIRQINGSKWGI